MTIPIVIFPQSARGGLHFLREPPIIGGILEKEERSMGKRIVIALGGNALGKNLAQPMDALSPIKIARSRKRPGGFAYSTLGLRSSSSMASRRYW